MSQNGASIITSTLVEESSQDDPLIVRNPLEVAPDLGSSLVI
jgi:hypothetical protein